MKKNKMFEMVISDGKNVFKVNRIGTSKQDVMNRYSGNGEFVRVKDITDDYPISEESLRTALGCFGETEQEAVLSLLRNHYENVIN